MTPYSSSEFLAPEGIQSFSGASPAEVPRWSPDDAVAAAAAASRRIAPLWPLSHFVAVNPFLGLTGRPFGEACELLARVAPGGMQMELAYYLDALREGNIADEDLAAALERAGETREIFGPGFLESLDPAGLREAAADLAQEEHPAPCLSFAETIDRLLGTRWSSALAEAVGDFCAARFDRGQSAWRQPWLELPLYDAWRRHASIDRHFEHLGLVGFRERIAVLPQCHAEALAEGLESLGVPSGEAEDYLHRLLLSLRGWAGHIQFLVRETEMRGGKDDSLVQFVAILVACEVALKEAASPPGLGEFWPPMHEESLAEEETDGRLAQGVALRLLLQLAHEHAWERRMRASLASAAAPTGQATDPRPETQAVFCIDVRSEVFRRALESVSPAIETIGFAGFFGLPLEYKPVGRAKPQAQCPVLLLPAYTVHECHHDAHADVALRKRVSFAKRLGYGWNAFKTSAVSCFSFVETAGLVFGGSLLRDAFAGHRSRPAPSPGVGPSLATIPSGDRVALAHGMLKNMGLVDGFSRLVLLCGHGSETANNPYGSGLDCGACGGHAGDANARVGAALLNDPAVRAGLLEAHGIKVPDDTWFLAGLHNTTTDDIELFDAERVPESHAADLVRLRERLAEAGTRSRRERAALLGLSSSDPRIDSRIRGRSRDWSQVRPEWGLAGNAAFVAAPRSRTRQATLGGRVFLHDYDHRKDPDNSILELIMCAPMVVANWINLQYYASTANNAVFGSGNKVIHNVVGTLGVCLGNNGDLQTGLPLQSVHDGERYVHEPLRLHVFLEAPVEGIDEVIGKHPGVRELVENQWLILFAIGEDGAARRRTVQGKWEA